MCYLLTSTSTVHRATTDEAGGVKTESRSAQPDADRSYEDESARRTEARGENAPVGRDGPAEIYRPTATRILPR